MEGQNQRGAFLAKDQIIESIKILNKAMSHYIRIIQGKDGTIVKVNKNAHITGSQVKDSLINFFQSDRS